MKWSLAASPPAERRSLLPLLLAVLLMMALWLVAEEAQDEYRQLSSRIGAARLAAARGGEQARAESLQQQLETARRERAELTDRLFTNDSVQMIRARMVYDLRQMCEATGASGCTVRLADDSLGVQDAPPGSSGSASSPAPATLASLGVQKARAIVSGSFQKSEPVELSRRLNRADDAVWRVRGFLVRGSTFEIDVERHLMTQRR